jgi:hypothetical protein
MWPEIITHGNSILLSGMTVGPGTIIVSFPRLHSLAKKRKIPVLKAKKQKMVNPR